MSQSQDSTVQPYWNKIIFQNVIKEKYGLSTVKSNILADNKNNPSIHNSCWEKHKFQKEIWCPEEFNRLTARPSKLLKSLENIKYSISHNSIESSVKFKYIPEHAWQTYQRTKWAEYSMLIELWNEWTVHRWISSHKKIV